MYTEVAEKPGSKLQVNLHLHERMHVKPLGDDEIAKYRLKKSDQDDITRMEESSGKKMKHQQVYSFVGRKTIYDPFNKRKVVIQNITGWKPEKLPSGEIKDNPIVSRVLFPRTGEIILSSRDNEQYAFMERMNENESNEFRDSKLMPKGMFYRVDVKKQTLKELERDYLVVDALIWLRDANEIEIQTIYRALDAETKKNINADAGFETIKRGLFELSHKNPILVLKASTNKAAKIKVQCMEAEKFHVIAFDEGTATTPRRWVYISGTPETICEMEPGTHKIDGLVKFFTTDKQGKDWYVKMVEGLKNVLDFKR